MKSTLYAKNKQTQRQNLGEQEHEQGVIYVK